MDDFFNTSKSSAPDKIFGELFKFTVVTFDAMSTSSPSQM